MYAERYSAGPAFKPGSLGLALAATALPLVALVFGLEIKNTLIRDPNMTTIAISDPPPPPPPDPAPQPKKIEQPNHELVYTPPIVPPVAPDPKIETMPQAPLAPPPALPPAPGLGDAGTVITPAQPPVIVGAQVDPRYAGLLQPPYPAEEIRAGREGRVVLKVLIGADGRVHQVERVSAASDAFFAATERQALAKWRFTPATRDGVAIEQWQTMTVRFVMPVE